MLSKDDIKKNVLELLIKKGAFRIAPNTNELFVLKSGRKSPTFVNTRALTDGESLNNLKRALAHFIANLLNDRKIENFDFIFGPAYNGIPLAVLACEGLSELYGINKRYLYDRKEEKNYGDKKMDQIIVGAGYFKPGQKILLIDDVITAGQTASESIEKLKILGNYGIVGMVLVVDRQEKMGGIENVEESSIEFIENKFGFKIFSILDMKSIFNAVKNNIPEEMIKCWIDYFKKYGTVKLGG